MTAEQFNIFWNAAYPGTIPLQQSFVHNYAHRWFRIHNLPQSKRYADNDYEWGILLNRQNELITDLLDGNPVFLLVTGEHYSEGYTELHPLDAVDSIKGISFVTLPPIDLHKIDANGYEPFQFYTPKFSEQIWQAKKFDNVLKDIAEDNLKAFFVSPDKELIIAPYDGGVDCILKDTAARNFYKQKYSSWLSARKDGL